MSTEADPNQNQNASPAEPKGGPPQSQEAAAKEAAAKALEQAKEKVAAGMDTFKRLDTQSQIYLAGLAVTVLCSLIFSFWTVKLDIPKMDGPMGDLVRQHMSAMPSVTVFDAGANGKLAVLAAAAGIGLWIWNFTTKKREAWAPLAIAGGAALSALMFLVLWLRMGSFSTGGLGGNVSAGTTILGFWLPFAGAIAATVVSVKRILNPQPPTA